MFWKFFVVAVVSSGLAYYAIAFSIGVCLTPIQWIGALRSRSEKFAVLLPFGLCIATVSQIAVWALWSAYCSKMVAYAHATSPWFDYLIALFALYYPLNKLVAAERRASGVTAKPWLYIGILLASFLAFCIWPTLSETPSPFGWLPNLILPLAYKMNLLISALVGLGAWIVIASIFRGTDSPNPADNPVGSQLHKLYSRGVAPVTGQLISENPEKMQDNNSHLASHPRLTYADKLSDSFIIHEAPSQGELVDILGNAVREAADAMVAEGLAESRDQVTGEAVRAYMVDYYTELEAAERPKDALSMEDLLPDLVIIGGFHIEASMREYGSVDYYEWVESMKTDCNMGGTDEFWQTVFNMAKDELLRRVIVEGASVDELKDLTVDQSS